MLRELKENLIGGIAGTGILIVLLCIIPAIFFEGINTFIKQVSVGWKSYGRGDKIAVLIMTVIISGIVGIILDWIYEQLIYISYEYNIETTTLIAILVFYCLISNMIWIKNKSKSKIDK